MQTQIPTSAPTMPRVASRMATPPPVGRRPAQQNGETRRRPVDEVHDAALDSFPASDPPSWGALRIGAPAAGMP